MFQQHDWSPDARCKRPRTLRPHTRELPSLRILVCTGQKQPNPNPARIHEVGNSRIGNLLCTGRPDACDQSQQNDRNQILPDHPDAPS